MAADGRMRHHCRPMRQGIKKASAGGAALITPRGGIRCPQKSGCGGSESGDHGVRTNAGASGNVDHVVKPGAHESEVKPSSPDSADEAWIYVRGCQIKRAGLRFDSQGDIYVPDSEDDDSGADLAPTVDALVLLSWDEIDLLHHQEVLDLGLRLAQLRFGWLTLGSSGRCEHVKPFYSGGNGAKVSNSKF